MKVTPLKLQGASLLEPMVHGDHRGFFMESYNDQHMQQHGLNYHFVQDNQSLSAQAGVLRGLHYQLNPKAQTKLIRVISGGIYDVIVDIRRGSPTFGQWEGFILSEHNYRQLLVPKGFAHGFCTLVPNTQVLYKVDEYYSPEDDRGILWNDPALGIDWPISNPILSVKDEKHPILHDAEINFNFG
ncbi:dTDP-4-dehydrorhamnose 3,5-epimerase [Paenibacillus sp. BGI2013]|uniref:dTDP-4-dehydrorhamnose 3,5-epimerase n=1 Tax=Paenibacillus TaxID=44249 RepID=UPI00096F1F10|nr:MULTISPECIES: dTDP-4-dehydrorhamnose 3,5-epimerase [Paenibacillus]OMF39721.1 dTDP-4-dehydrorhamnose 3,5-epimerase [Paenibacillus amylolyticus]PKQ92480.1 dTDP-4-dehydrorhamnose 3,5-epimerase [Paenibacillus sp. BGI2013]WKL03995.1 dTDP-4-dehydrorhamnose 3,5-epimerase [Paenibacillus amylolyticus]